MRQTSRAFLSLLALSGLVVSTWASPARAADCTSDQDCEAGYQCVKGVSTPGCDPSAPDGCPDPTPVEAEVGTCEIAPIECTSDASACPEYLTCLENQDGACWANSDGTTGCDEPDPDAPKYCGFQQTTCSSDGDCPREFECVESTTTDCACDLKGDCAACEPTTVKQCQPRQIECATDSECPSDWSCIEVVSGGGCATSGDAGAPTGSGSSGTGSIGVGGADSGGTTDPSEPATDLPTTEEPLPTDACEETVTTAHYCAPKTLINYGYGYDLSADGGIAQESANGSDDGGSGAPKGPEAPHEKAEDEGGCSVAPMLGGSGGMFAPLMLLAPLAARIGRRRRAS